MSEERNVGARRRRRTRAEIEEAVREFLASGLGRREFCRKREFALSTLERHLPAHTAKLTPRPGMVEVQVGPAGQNDEQRSRGNLALVLRNGYRIEVGEDFDPGTLQRLVQALEN